MVTKEVYEPVIVLVITLGAENLAIVKLLELVIVSLLEPVILTLLELVIVPPGVEAMLMLAPKVDEPIILSTGMQELVTTLPRRSSCTGVLDKVVGPLLHLGVDNTVGVVGGVELAEGNAVSWESGA